MISIMLAPGGEIKHLNQMHRLICGSLSTPLSKWLQPMAQLLSSSGIDFSLSDNIEQTMWDKIVFLTTLAGSTCTLRASIGDIMSTVAGESFITGLLDECARIAEASGHPLAESQVATFRKLLTERGSPLTASMLRDIERGGQTEADHILGDMVDRSRQIGISAPWLSLAYSHLQAYEIRRKAA